VVIPPGNRGGSVQPITIIIVVLGSHGHSKDKTADVFQKALVV